VSFLRKKWLVSLLLFLVSFGAYVPSLRNDFVWDDVETIEQSYYTYNASSIGYMFFPPEKEAKDALYYRPLIYSSMVLDKTLWGVSAFGFHLTNIALNALAAVSMYLFALLLLGELGHERKHASAFIAGVLFAFYPMHVESVSWVSGRSDVLCALFFFLAFIFHMLSLKKAGFLVLTALAFSLSLLSKEVAVVFPLTTLAFDLINRSRGRSANILRYAVYASVLALFFYLRGRTYVNLPEISSIRVPGGSALTESGDGAAGILGIIEVLSASYSYYFSKLVFPFTFNAFTESPPGGLINAVSAVIISGLITLGVIYSIKKRRSVSAFALLWIPVTLFPSVLVALTDIPAASVAERYLYIPSAGFCLLLGSVSAHKRESAGVGRVLIAAAFLLAASYLFFTVVRQGVWRDGIALWEDTTRKSPMSAIPRINYGIALLDAGREDEALKELLKNFEDGVKISDKGRSVTANNIGVVYINKKDIRNAEEWFLKAYGYDQGYYKSSYHLGLVNYLKGKSGGSREHYIASIKYLDIAARLRPYYGKAYLLLAMVYVELGDGEKARENAGLAIESGLTDPLAVKARKIMSTPD
jgi:tetratricopeptide (TPR) repeat protein